MVLLRGCCAIFPQGWETLWYWDHAEVLVGLAPSWQPWKLQSLFIHRLDG